MKKYPFNYSSLFENVDLWHIENDICFLKLKSEIVILYKDGEKFSRIINRQELTQEEFKNYCHNYLENVN